MSRRSRSSTATLLLTNASGLLISWATPATSWPRLASFSVSTIRLCAALSASCAWRSDSRQLLERDVLLLELLLGPHPLGHVPEDALDADRLAVGAEERASS